MRYAEMSREHLADISGGGQAHPRATDARGISPLATAPPSDTPTTQTLVYLREMSWYRQDFAIAPQRGFGDIYGVRMSYNLQVGDLKKGIIPHSEYKHCHYVGFTQTSLETRIMRHWSETRNRKFICSMKRYGFKEFEFFFIRKGVPEADLLDTEDHFIEFFGTLQGCGWGGMNLIMNDKQREGFVRDYRKGPDKDKKSFQNQRKKWNKTDAFEHWKKTGVLPDGSIISSGETADTVE